MPCWWRELRAIPGVEDLQKPAQKIWASFSIPKVRGKIFLGQEYTAPPAPRCLNWNAFLPNELSYLDVHQQPLLLTITYAQGLQYWVEKLNPPENPDFCLLARSILELRERVEKHVMFTDQDIFQDIDGINLEVMSQWPQTSLPGLGRREPLLEDQLGKQNICFTKAMTQTVSLAATNLELVRCITPPDRREEENGYVLVITTSIEQLNLGTTDGSLIELEAAPPGKDTYQNQCIVAVFLVPVRRAISHQGTTVEELEDLMDLTH